MVNNPSDLHIKAGSAPKIRISGSLVAKLTSSNTHDFSVMLKRAGVDPELVDAQAGG